MNALRPLVICLLLVGRTSAQMPPEIETRTESNRRTIDVTWRTREAIESAAVAAIPTGDRFRLRQRTELVLARSREVDAGWEHRATLRIVSDGEDWLVRVGDGSRWSEWYPVPEPLGERGEVFHGPATDLPAGPANSRLRYAAIAVLSLAALGYLFAEMRHRRRLRAIRTR